MFSASERGCVWGKRDQPQHVKPRKPAQFFKRRLAVAPRRNLCHVPIVNLGRIRERLSNGFKPFVLELSSGKRLRVPDPEFIMIGKNVVVVMGQNDSVTMADALHIVAMENLPVKKRPRQN
jgi:hypothetical protein